MTYHSLVLSSDLRPDFAVLGGGLIGRLIAWRLAGSGHRVALYESGNADGSGAAASIAAGMLSPISEAASSEKLIVKLGVASLELWPKWLDELPERVFFQKNGTLVVWHYSDRSEAMLFERRVRENAPTTLFDSSFIPLTSDQINITEPALAGRFLRGLLLLCEGQLDNRHILHSLAVGLAERGVDIHWNTMIHAYNAPSTHFTIDCRGLGAKTVLPELRGIRGEIARIHAPGIGLTRPVRLLHPRYPLYLVPKQNDLYVVGATEVESEDMSGVSVRSALELLSAMFSVHPAFGEARILEWNTHCRPTLPNHRPAVIWDGASTLIVNGLYRHGFMIGPEIVQITVELAEAMLCGEVYDEHCFASWRNASRWPELLH
ncbi:MAG: FAD-dependent oxidoreductase [Burkholderia sp.]|nr:FAD-dependent oxidoreductase [Burkholderia sp.]